MSDPYRQSALLLHGLDGPDRAWLLGQLPEQQRLQLDTHLAELQRLGMPAERGLAEALLAGARATTAAPERDYGHALRMAPASAVLPLLLEEPNWLIAAVLSIEPWPWREAIFVALDASQRERVKQALREGLPRKLSLALVSVLEQRLQDAPAVIAPAPPLPGPFGRVLRRFKASLPKADVWR